MLGGQRLRQHIVEFIRGTGIVTDGIIDTSQGTTGPFTWTGPQGVAEVTLDVVAAGIGGGGGGFVASMISCGGGGGGAASWLQRYSMAIVPGTQFTATVGVGGAGAGLNGFSQNSNITSSFVKTGSAVNTMVGYGISVPPGGGAGPGSASISAATNGGGGGTFFGAGSSGGQNGASGSFTNYIAVPFGTGFFFCLPGLSGGGGNASGAVAGGNGGAQWGGQLIGQLMAIATPGNGITSGGISYGGGGPGATGPFGVGGAGGNGNTNGSDAPATNWGSGGGGGGGNGIGGKGADGYIRLTYWSMD